MIVWPPPAPDPKIEPAHEPEVERDGIAAAIRRFYVRLSEIEETGYEGRR